MGCWSSEPQTLRLCNISQCHFCIYQSAIGDETKREKLMYVYMVYYLFRRLYPILVCGGGYFFHYRLNVKMHVQHFLFISIFTEMWNDIYTLSCINALSNCGFYVVDKNRFVKYFFGEFFIKMRGKAELQLTLIKKEQ